MGSFYLPSPVGEGGPLAVDEVFFACRKMISSRNGWKRIANGQPRTSVPTTMESFYLPSPVGEGGPLAVDEVFLCLREDAIFPYVVK